MILTLTLSRPRQLLDDDRLSGVPLLVWANKQDVPTALSTEQLVRPPEPRAKTKLLPSRSRSPFSPLALALALPSPYRSPRLLLLFPCSRTLHPAPRTPHLHISPARFTLTHRPSQGAALNLHTIRDRTWRLVPCSALTTVGTTH